MCNDGHGVRSIGPVLLTVFLLLACDEATPAPVDGGPDATRDGASVIETPPSPPVPPAPPVLTPCPAGWREIVEDELAACEPWESGAAPCPEGTARFVGDAACAPLGPPCPAGGFADEGLVDPIYVRAGATGGDGSEGRPYAAITDALAARSTRPIVVAPGTYRGALSLHDGATIVGACTAETVIEGPPGATGIVGATVRLVAGSARLRGVTVRGPAVGVRVTDSELAFENVIVASTSFGGVMVGPQAAITIDGLVVRDVSEDASTFGSGVGLSVINRAHATGSRLVIERTVATGLMVLGAGVATTLSDVVVRDVAVDGFVGTSSVGVSLGREATVRLDRLLVERVAINAVYGATGAEVTMTDLVIRDVGGFPKVSHAVEMTEGSRAFISRASIIDLDTGGIGAIGAESSVTVADARIERLRPAPTAAAAPGIFVTQLAGAALERVRIADTTGVGVVAGAEGETLRLRDVHIATVRYAPEFAVGRGLSVENAQVDAERVRVDDTVDIGVLVAGVYPGRLTDLDVRRVSGETAAGDYGRGISLQTYSRSTSGVVEFERVRVAEAHEVALIVIDSVVRVRDLVIEDTLFRVCATSTCPDFAVGAGMMVTRRGDLTVERFISTRSALVGVQVEDQATISARDGVVSGNVIGLNVRNPEFDIAGSFVDVAFVDNETNLDSMILPVPGPITSVEP